ncbi:hypothetical protein LMG33810_000944 [Carnimonas sp. LMG 33810]
MKITREHKRWLSDNGFNVIAVFRHEVVAQTVMGESYRFTKAALDERVGRV